MDAKVIMGMIFNVIGGLGIFMLGMKYMSEGLQTIAGDRLRRLISMVTSNRFFAVAIGTFVTVMIQSSSVTTVMVVGFVNSGFMTLTQAIGVVMGANIGTTITGWILVLKIGKYGLPLLGVFALVYRFVRNEFWQYLGMALMGVGMIFFGLALMKTGFKPIRSMPEFAAWFHMFDASTYFGVLKCALIGCLLTCIVQSSSATLGITIGLASTGVIPFETAAALVLGENIGTTITAFIASLGTTTNAKRAAYAHVIFNILGVIWITALFGVYIKIVKAFLGVDPNLVEYKLGDQMIEASRIILQDGSAFIKNAADELVKVEIIYPHVTKAIATVHTGFNIANVALFVWVIPYLARFLERIVPDKPFKEEPHLTRLDSRMIETPALGIEQSRVEIVRMGEEAKKMLEKLRKILGGEEGSEKLVKKLFHREEVMDIMQKEVVIFLTDLLGDRASHEVADEARRQLRMADELESISDYISAILKLHLKLEQEDLAFPEAERNGLLALHKQVEDYMALIEQGFEDRHPEVISKAHSHGDAITHHYRELREAHLARCSESRMNSLITVNYINALNSYRRVKDHALNFAEALAGEK